MLRLILPRAAPRRLLAQRQRLFSSLPSHEVVGMPAMSPTMEVGTIVNWCKAEGDLVSAGETIAEIETDKATINFDAVDDAYIARILVEAGSEVTVGAPIMVTVEEQSDVAAFSGYAVDPSSSSSPPSTPEVSAPVATPVAAPTPPVTPPPVTATATVPTPAPPVVKASAPITPPPSSLPSSSSSSSSSSSPPSPVAGTQILWGSLVSSTSTLAAKIAKDQQAYVEKYGNSSHAPLDC